MGAIKPSELRESIGRDGFDRLSVQFSRINNGLRASYMSGANWEFMYFNTTISNLEDHQIKELKDDYIKNGYSFNEKRNAKDPSVREINIKYDSSEK